jgi:Family of unknown function (DUF6427)
LLFIFGVLIKLTMFLHPHVPDIQSKDGILFQAILRFLKPTGQKIPVIYPALAYAFLYLQALSLNRLINEHRMTIKPGFLPGMAYLLVTSLFPEWNYFSAPLLVNTITILLLLSLFKIYNQQQAKGTVFNMGLGIGIASFIFFPSITFIFWTFFALLVMRPFRINEWLLCLLGVTTPYYFYAVYLFITDQWNWQKILPYVTIDVPRLQQSFWLACSAFLLCVPFLIGGYHIQNNLRRMLIQVRKGWSLILLYLLAAVFVPFVNSTDTFENWVIVAIPFAAFHAPAYQYPTQKWFPLVLFWITVAFILLYQYYGPGW